MIEWNYREGLISRNSLIFELTQLHVFDDGTELRTLAICDLGNRLWMVKECKGDARIWLTFLRQKDTNIWGVLQYDEGEGPFDASCPLQMIDIAGPPNPKYPDRCQKVLIWRDTVRKWHRDNGQASLQQEVILLV